MEKTIGTNRKDWFFKFDVALWAFKSAYRTSIGFFPFELVYRRTCHLLVEIVHKTFWALKKCNINDDLFLQESAPQLNKLD